MVTSGNIGGVNSRSPYGERGLKSRHAFHATLRFRSLSLRRAWIEIFLGVPMTYSTPVALLTESVD